MSDISDNSAPPPTDTAAPFGFTFGLSHTQSSWSDFRRMTWPQLVTLLTSHVPGPKEGTCIVPARFSGTRRNKDDASRIDVAFLDSDSGAPLADIEQALIRNGWEGVISSTHSHMCTTTKVALSNWDRYFADHPSATPEQFLIDEKGYLPTVAQGAKPIETISDLVIVAHQPCPKFRIAIPLERPWLAANYASQTEANAVWKERIEALAASLGLNHDQACTDTSRLFYLPRRPAEGVVPETAVVSGSHCDIFSLPGAQTHLNGDFFHHTQKPKNGRAGPDHGSTRSDSDSKEFIDPTTGEVFDLTDWAKSYGSRFLLAKALKARKPGIFTGYVVDHKHHIDCPNASRHTDPSRDNATYVMDAPASGTKGFVVHCRHGHCTDKDRLFFVRRMLEQNWLTIEDLKSSQFLEKEAKQDEKSTPNVFELVWFDAIEPITDTLDFVQGLLIEGSSVVVFGEPNAGKTFWMTDLALHVAAGMKWYDRRVGQGCVIYCVLEGGNGFRNRVAAWKKQHGLEGEKIPFAAIQSSINLLDPDADTEKLIRTIQAAAAEIGMPVKLVVIDTLSRAMAGGNENAPEDMGALVMNIDRIRFDTKACAVGIHHSGKDASKGSRGHSSLRGAIDTEIEVVAEEGSETKVATVLKQRDLKKGDTFTFTLSVIDLGKNRHSEQVTSCVVVQSQNCIPDSAMGPSPHTNTGGAVTRLRGHEKRAYQVLTDLICTSGKIGFPGTPPGVATVPEKWWREQFMDRCPGENPDTKGKAFRRSVLNLVNSKLVGANCGRVWPAGHGYDAGHFSGQKGGQMDE